AGGAPLAAAGLTETGVAALDSDMTASLLALGRNAADVTLLADHWVRNDLPLRIAWLENWITGSLYSGVVGPATSKTAGRVRLPAQPQKAKIRALFDLLDGVRELRRLAATGINQQLALEALLLGGRHALTS
ncbi:MAG: hypothetical protein M3O06_06980, partial [Pseudomonadota bacterium]|nr:hypothetical protein [Pseudomonadota bacterium]